MAYNKTYAEIRDLLKQSKRVSKKTMLYIARLAIKETLMDRVEVEDIHWDSKFVDDLDADSLDLVELVMFLEECFNIEIEDEVAMEIVTVGDAIEAIKEAKQNKGKPRKKIDASKYLKKKPAPGGPIAAGGPKIGHTQPNLEAQIKEALEEDETRDKRSDGDAVHSEVEPAESSGTLQSDKQGDEDNV
jgi:acyl carrier protein